MAGERSTYGQWSFNAGELGPRMHARVDQAVYQNGVAEMVGFLPLLQGPVIAAPGTRFVAAAAGPCRLFPFEFVPTQGYVIEGSNLKFRFYTNNARIETAPGTAYEVAHPYSYADLLALDYWQSEDVIYLAGAGKKPQKLSRTSATTFALVDLDLKNGPIEIGNSDEGILLSVVPSDFSVGMPVTITANNAIFAPGDIGSLFEIECEDFGDIKSWEPAVKLGGLAVGMKLKWGGNVYLIEGVSGVDGYTGSAPPEHDSGSEWDGSSGMDGAGNGPFGVKLKHLYGRFGLVRITGLIDASAVTATVIKRLPDSLGAVVTWRWAFGAFSDTRGWPDTVGGWNDCLVFTKGNRAYTSVIGDYENFERRDHHGDFQRDLAGQFTLPQPAKINWQASDRFLLLGTDTAEYTVERVQVQTGSAGPPVFEIRLQSSNGSAKVKPIQADGRMLFLQRAGRKLREMGYAISSDRYVAPDMTRLADHIGAPGLVELAWQAEPERLAWAVRGDGSLAAMTYDPEQQVMGWCRRPLGGGILAKSACRITDPEGRRDQLWIAAEAGGAHWVLRMEKAWETGDDRASAFLVDAGLSYSGPPATVIAGLDHLNGMTVDILADAKPHARKTVLGGTVTLDYPASEVQAGLPFDAWILTLPPESGQSEGVARGKLQRVIDLDLHLVETPGGLQVTVQDNEPISVETRNAGDPLDSPPPMFSGVFPLATIGSYDRKGQIRIARVQPTPVTIVALVPAHEVAEI